ncbi:hypothetical protein ID866_7777 [Astraeus odoratus]|nr:hypothetical protein ID866_7777 [Astraeus odoratus]
MYLINVEAILDISSDLVVDSKMEVLAEHNEDTPYAILSHCWDEPKHEVGFREMRALPTMEEDTRKAITKRSGYLKIVAACRRARWDRLKWVWADTCCINKESSAELSEAINSMFRWYKNSKRCYAYLHDLFPECNGWPKWFSRGWTLQELIAPKDMQFFNKSWRRIGDKQNIGTADILTVITRVPQYILTQGMPKDRPSVAQIMSWAAERKTTRVEDRAYSLLGLLDVNMTMLYGEGKRAFRRLQLEIIRQSNDQSIFAWDIPRHHRDTQWSGSILAEDPVLFRGCHNVIRMEPEQFIKFFEGDVGGQLRSTKDERLGVFLVTNRGIQISLPIRRHSTPWGVAFRAILSCCRDRSPVTIDLIASASNYLRYSGGIASSEAAMEFQQLFLAC